MEQRSLDPENWDTDVNVCNVGRDVCSVDLVSASRENMLLV